MSNKLKKIDSNLEWAELGLKAGDFVICSGGNLYKIGKILSRKKLVDLHNTDGKGGYSHYGDIEFKRFYDLEFIKIEGSYEELEKEIFEKVLNLEQVKKEVSDERALAIYDKNYLVNLKKDMQEKQKKFELMSRILERKRNELYHIVSEYEGQLTKIMKVLGSIELYLGINEEIIQISKGDKADTNEPICLFQKILFMDEEVGDPAGGGLDFKNIEDFDDWLLKERNFEKIIPAKKGVVVLRVRREDKHYSNDWIHNWQENIQNHFTYILIRNGNNLYRVWADIIIYPRLFPMQEELLKAKDDVFESEKVEDKIFSYKQNMMLLQGLIDRTEIFKPLKNEISLFKLETCEGVINFIGDDELSLSEGKMYYRDWRKKINSKIKVGSRIYFSGFTWEDTREDAPRRYPFYVHGSSPKAGVYTIKRIEEGEYKDALVCHFNPKDDIYSNKYWGEGDHERKKSIPFYIYEHDNFFLNYDLISLEDVEYYINSRLDRENYLHMIPALWGIRKRRLKEIEWEKGFVDNLKLRLDFEDKKKLGEIILKAIDWWKYKVKWKRPIMQEDAKALRMITARIKKQLEGLSV